MQRMKRKYLRNVNQIVNTVEYNRVFDEQTDIINHTQQSITPSSLSSSLSSKLTI